MPSPMMSNANGSGSGLATKKHGQPEPEQAARRDQDSEDDLDEDKPNATSYAVSDGTTVDVPDEVASAIDSFVVPEGYVAEGSRSQSMVYCWGVYLVPAKGHDDPDADARFYCMASEDCRSKECCIPCKNRHRGNVHKHLKKHHHLCGSRSMAHARKNERAGKSPKKAATVGRVSSDGVGLVRWVARKSFFWSTLNVLPCLGCCTARTHTHTFSAHVDRVWQRLRSRFQQAGNDLADETVRRTTAQEGLLRLLPTGSSYGTKGRLDRDGSRSRRTHQGGQSITSRSYTVLDSGLCFTSCVDLRDYYQY